MKLNRFTSFCVGLIMLFAFCFQLSSPLISLASQGETQIQTDTQQNTEIPTDIFLPTSYLQYYKLDNPRDIFYDESDESVVIIQDKSIVIYKNEKFSKVQLDYNSENANNIIKIGNFILYSYKSRIFTININDEIPLPVSTEIVCAYPISVYGNTLAVATSTSIEFYEITDSENTFSYTQLNEKSQNQTATAMVLTASGDVYYQKQGELSIYKLGEDTPVVQNIGSVRYFTQYTSGDKNCIYYTTIDGIFELDTKTYAIRTIKSVGSDLTLGSVSDPYGLCIKDGNLWYVDTQLLAVQEINLDTLEFTEFAITTNSKAVNRLSEDVQKISISGENLYALDKDRIVKVENIYGKNTYKLITLSSDASTFAVGGGYIAIYQGSELYIYKEGDAVSNELQMTQVFNKNFQNLVDIEYKNDKFYILQNQLKNQTERVTAVVSIDLKGELGFVITQIAELSGDGVAVNIDDFGQVFVAVKGHNANTKTAVYRLIGKDIDLLTEISGNIKELHVDLKSNVFLLQDDNQIVCINADGSLIFNKSLSLSPNLIGVGDSINFAMNSTCSKVFYLFEGLILSSIATDCGVSTIYNISIPTDISFEYTKDIDISSAFISTKAIEIEFDKNSEFFNGKGFVEVDTVGNEFIIKNAGEFALLICFDRQNYTEKFYLFRWQDLSTEKLTSIESSGELYAVNDLCLYSQPLLIDLYKGETVPQNSKVKLHFEVEFSGVSYFIVEYNGNFGFVPKTFLVQEIQVAEQGTSIKTIKVYNKNGVSIYSDESLNQYSHELNGVVELVLISQSNGICKVDIQGEIFYLSSDFIFNVSSKTKLNTFVLVLLSISLFFTLIYIIKTNTKKS